MSFELKNTLIERIKDLPEPIGGYYMGTSPAELILPENIIVVGRHEGHYPSVHDIVHHRFLLALNFDGAGSVVLDGVRFNWGPGNAILVFPHQYHHFFWVNPRMRWIFITFELAKPGILEKLRSKVLRLSNNALEYLDSLTKDYKGSNDQNCGEINRIVLCTGLLLNELMTSCSNEIENDSRENSTPSLVDQINEYIVSNIQESISVNELADEFSYSPSRLRTIYKEGMGISIGRYIKETRLHKAESYLGTTDMTVSEIAKACGYESLYSFSHSFKNRLGISPSIYRKRFHGKS